MAKAVIILFITAITLCLKPISSKADHVQADDLLDGKLLTCFVYSLHTIPLLNQLQQKLKQEDMGNDIQELITAVGGKDKIQTALFDAEIVLETFSKNISERYIVKMDQRLCDNPMWKLSNSIHDEWVKGKSLKEVFLGTFNFTQKCIDDFM
jgi:hypothetical protein